MIPRLTSLLAAAGLAFIASGAFAQETEITCEEARCLFQQEITSLCPCEGNRNHGQYVKCVGRVIRELSSNGSIPRNCRGRIVRCAARSTCGKDGFVTCTKVNLGVCDPALLTCTEPAGLGCATNDDCVISSRCSTKRSAETCIDRGGVVGESPTCCSSCLVETTPAP